MCVWGGGKPTQSIFPDDVRDVTVNAEGSGHGNGGDAVVPLHVGRMNDDRMPKRVLFGELPATRPRHGPRKRWRDVIVDDLRSISPPVPSDCWFDAAQDRSAWRQIAHRRPPARAPPDPDSGFRCACGKVCRRPGDLKRHAPYYKASR